MDIRYEYVNITRNNYFEYLMEEKLKPLGRKFPYILGADVFFKIENKSDKIQNICEIRLNTPEPELFASTHQESIEQAIKESAKDIEQQLENRKE